MNSTQPLTISFGGYSTKGAKATNQDAFALKQSKGISLDLKGHVAAIADGVSSANCSAQASQMSVCHFIEEYLATPQSWSVNKSAAKVLGALNSWLYSRMSIKTVDNVEQQWFSTFSAIVFKNSQAHIFHVGDCQIAKLNDEGYQVLTKDHSTPSGILNRALGASHHVEVDLSVSDIETGDIFILGCDGVCNYVNNKEIKATIDQHENLEEASKAITQLAHKNGSLDNLTCLLVKIDYAPALGFNQLITQRRQQAIPPALFEGALLDHFKILSIKQQTARSHVYLAEDTTTQQRVIIKTPSINFSEDDDYLNNFIKEGWIGEKFNNDGLMRIYPQQNRSKFLYHVCEFIEGQTLDVLMTNNELPSFDTVNDLLQQMVASLRVLQRMDVIHCDLKPDNFMVDQENNIKLIDYGSCSIGSFYQAPESRILGTLSYSAPEVLKDKAFSHKSDMFSLAVIVYQMLCKEMPFKAIDSEKDIPSSYTHWQYRPVNTFRNDLPNNINQILQHSLQANPKKRIDSYSQLIEGFKAQTQTTFSKAQNNHKLSLLEANPVFFWKCTSGILLGLLMASLFS